MLRVSQHFPRQAGILTIVLYFRDSLSVPGNAPIAFRRLVMDVRELPQNLFMVDGHLARFPRSHHGKTSAPNLSAAFVKKILNFAVRDLDNRNHRWVSECSKSQGTTLQRYS